MGDKYLMDQMSKEKNWGISSDEKVPIFCGDFLQTHDPRDLTPITKADMDKLPTLVQLDQNYELQDVIRCYHMHANTNLIVAFDVEPKSDPSFLKWFASQDAHYREYSMHYGVHLFYHLNRARLSDTAVEMLTTETERKMEYKVNGKLLSYEYMMNNHWLTFTRRKFGNMIPLSQDAPDWVYDLTEKLANDWIQTRHKKIEINYNIQDHASDLAKKMAQGLFTSDRLNQRLTHEITLDAYNDDDSKYEYNVAIRLAGYLEWRINNPRPFDVMLTNGLPLTSISLNDRIWAVSLKLKDIVPARDKDNEMRDGLPWLVYVSKTAYDYLIDPANQSDSDSSDDDNSAEENADPDI